MKTPESKEKAKICAYLDSIGAWYCKPATYGFGKSGTPDIVGGIANGRFKTGRLFTIEVKREGKQPTKLQEARMTAIKKVGGLTFWGVADKVVAEMEEYRKWAEH